MRRHMGPRCTPPAILPVLALLAASTAGVLTGGCGASGGRTGFEEASPSPTEPAPATAPTGDFGTKPPPESKPVEIAEVFGHSPTTLYRLDPQTKGVTTVGDFDGCTNVIDIALDEASTMFATVNPSGAGTEGGLYEVDKATAKCTLVKAGTYPNSLSFVPKGTVDANAEALVGYDEGDYVRIDTQTGTITVIGALASGDLISSGDVVSVKGTGGKTFLTVKNSGNKGTCSDNDCLVEVDPRSGKVVKFWGSIEHNNVFGLAFWGGSVYGFDDTGALFEVTFGTSQLATATIPFASAPPGLKFWGAGSSTSVPLVAPAK